MNTAEADVQWTPMIQIVRGHVMGTRNGTEDASFLPALDWCDRATAGPDTDAFGVHRMPGPKGELRYWIGASVARIPIGPTSMQIRRLVFKSWLSRDRSLRTTLDMLPEHVRAAFRKTRRSVWILVVYA